jgi:methylmalonyl-CoA/ethylmalonyl-CoA epimerase
LTSPPGSLDFKLLHVGVAVPALGPTTELLSTLFGYKVVSGPFDDPIQRVSVNFLAKSDQDPAEIELIAPNGEDSPIRSMLAKDGGGAYHLCFETSDIDGALAHAKQSGCIIVALPVPAVAFNGRRIAWIYSRSRQLFELVEAETVFRSSQPEM